MTFSSELCVDFAEYSHGCGSGDARAQRRFGAAALACIAFACAWTLWTDLGGADRTQQLRRQSLTVSPPRVTRAAVSRAYARLAAALRASAPRLPVFDISALLYDSRPLGPAPQRFATITAVVDDGGPATSAPRPAAKALDILPPRRRPSALSTRNAAFADSVPVRRSVAVPADHKPTIFEKLFGKPAPLALAYAADDDGIGGMRTARPGRYDRWTAVYDISAHAVYMPDGTVLEAHSGLGSRLDDPRFTEEKMRGATPPAVYDLRLREGLFHGVQALRLIPDDDNKVFGRTGLLAHTYMLGPSGQSNGCVSFRNYHAFLQAYMRGDVKRLAVVSRID
jgi:hypothetical protein